MPPAVLVGSCCIAHIDVNAASLFFLSGNWRHGEPLSNAALATLGVSKRAFLNEVRTPSRRSLKLKGRTQGRACCSGQALIALVTDDRRQSGESEQASFRDDAELAQMTLHGVQKLCALADQLRARAVLHRQTLLLKPSSTARTTYSAALPPRILLPILHFSLQPRQDSRLGHGQ
jgi:hypothetical protein